MPQYKTNKFIKFILEFPEQKINYVYDLLDELRDDLYEADELDNDNCSIEKSILELEEILSLLIGHVELKKYKNSRLTELEKLYLQLKK